MVTSGPVDLVGLSPLMQRTSGAPDVTIGLIDGPVATRHPDLAASNIKFLQGRVSGECARADSAACAHGTFVAGILSGRRGAGAPAIAPGCTLLVRPIFSESAPGELPTATSDALADAIVDCVAEGANVINLSAAFGLPSASADLRLTQAIDHAARRGVIVVAAAGNQGTVGSSCITRHPWVIPVAACSRQGRPLGGSNMGRSIGRFGLSAPGEGVDSLAAEGERHPSGGTSVAAPFVTGAVALLFSEFPGVTAAQVKLAVLASGTRRSSVVPPLLDAWAAYQVLLGTRSREAVA